MKDEEIAQFQTDFREVMLFCKYMKDKEKLSELLNKNPAYRNMDQKAIRVIEAVANTKIQVNEKEEKGNVCEGLQGIIDDAIQEEKKKATFSRPQWPTQWPTNRTYSGILSGYTYSTV